MATALGTAQNKSSADPWTALSSVTLATGDALIVVLAYDAGAGSPAVTWNSISLPVDVERLNSGNVRTQIRSLLNVTGATADIVVDWLITPPVAMTLAAYKESGLETSGALDKTATGTGSGTAASAGPTATLAQPDELIIGGIGVEDEIDDQTGAWTTGAGNVSGNEQATGTNGAGDASNISIYTAAEVVAATTAQTAEVTGMDSIDWAACIATYKFAAAGASLPIFQRPLRVFHGRF